jgi:hypothetical protein
VTGMVDVGLMGEAVVDVDLAARVLTCGVITGEMTGAMFDETVVLLVSRLSPLLVEPVRYPISARTPTAIPRATHDLPDQDRALCRTRGRRRLRTATRRYPNPAVRGQPGAGSLRIQRPVTRGERSRQDLLNPQGE